MDDWVPERCPACSFTPEWPPTEPNWRRSTSYEDLIEAQLRGVPIHDSTGECVREIVRPGFTMSTGDLTAAVYTLHRNAGFREYVRKVEQFDIFLRWDEIRPVTDAEQAAALEAVRRSIQHTTRPQEATHEHVSAQQPSA